MALLEDYRSPSLSTPSRVSPSPEPVDARPRSGGDGSPPRDARAHATSTVPQKRKAEDEDALEPAVSCAIDVDRDGEEDDELPDGEGDEYVSGKIICDACGEAVIFRDPDSGKLQIEKWDAHRRECPAAASSASKTTTRPASVPSDADADADEDNDEDAEGSPADEPADLPPVSSIKTPNGAIDASDSAAAALPPLKRRRAKRTEDERIEYLRADPYVARFEPYRVLCASCDKWIRLRPNSTYCSIPWDAHRKSCLAKKGATAPPGARSTAFASDPNVKKFDADRVHCRTCTRWITVGADDAAIQAWSQHRMSCDQASVSSAASAAPGVPPPSKHQLALVSMPVSSRPASSSSTTAAGDAPRVFKATSEILAAALAHDKEQASAGGQESRRRNADQRAAILRQDPLLAEVEPHRVYCSLCQKWVQLRQDSTYCANPWQQHRSKCIVRAEKKELKAHDLAAKTGGGAGVLRVVKFPPIHTSSASEADGASMGDAMEIDARSTPRSASGHVLADLDTPVGRVAFIQRSISHLYGTTYERTDELTLASLLAYLNCAVPPDKHEDFDTAEVIGAATTLQARGVLELRGDVLRPLSLD